MENRTGKRLFNLRTKAKLSQRELGEICNVDQKTISRSETGTFSPSIKTLEKLCKGLNIDVWKFFKEW